jgi:hypothetical protein
MDLKEEDILGADIGHHWYYRSKAAALGRAVGRLAPRRILDIGAGSGFFSRHLLAEGGAQSALCVDIGYPVDRDDSVAGKPVLYALFIAVRVLLFGIDTPGYASLLIVVLSMGAIQLVSIGIIGEYLGRLFLEVKGRPIYVVEGVYEEGNARPPLP